MVSNKSYLIRAIRDWCVDQGLTPYMTIVTGFRGLKIPQNLQNQPQVIFNLADDAIDALMINPKEIVFDAQFSGVIEQLRIPMGCIIRLCAEENGEGLVFEAEEEDDETDQDAGEASGGASKRSHLTLVK